MTYTRVHDKENDLEIYSLCSCSFHLCFFSKDSLNLMALMSASIKKGNNIFPLYLEHM